jgi:hypothetical protein
MADDDADLPASSAATRCSGSKGAASNLPPFGAQGGLGAPLSSPDRGGELIAGHRPIDVPADPPFKTANRATAWVSVKHLVQRGPKVWFPVGVPKSRWSYIAHFWFQGGRGRLLGGVRPCSTHGAVLGLPLDKNVFADVKSS